MEVMFSVKDKNLAAEEVYTNKKDEYNLNVHMNEDTSENLCVTCDKGLTKKWDFERHIKHEVL